MDKYEDFEPLGDSILDWAPPEGWTVIDAIGIIRCMDPDGEQKLFLSNREGRDLPSILGDIEYTRQVVQAMVWTAI